MMSLNFAPFELYDEEHDLVVQYHNSNIRVGILFFYIYGWIFLKMN